MNEEEILNLQPPRNKEEARPLIKSNSITINLPFYLLKLSIWTMPAENGKENAHF